MLSFADMPNPLQAEMEAEEVTESRIERWKAEHAELQILYNSYQRLFAGSGDAEDAARVLAHLRQETGIDTTCFVPGGTDSTAFNLGRRSIFLNIQNHRSAVVPTIDEYIDGAKVREGLHHG